MTVPDVVSDEQLAEWERRVEAATDGEWYVQRRGGSPLEVRAAWPDEDLRLASVEYLPDADFIVHAHIAVPLLVRALRDARAELAAHQHALEAAEGERDEWHAEYAQMRLNWDTAREFNNRAMEGLAERDALRTENERLRTRADRLQADTYRLRLQLSAALPSDPEHPERACGCRRCDDADRDTLPWLERIGRTMVVCPECGNKRCPRAEWHGNDCTGRALAAPTGQEQPDA